MLNSIIRFSVRNKLVIGLLVLALTGMGIYEFTRLPIDAVPDITNNQVQVITISPSMAAPEVERLITFPIEQATASVPGILEMRSFSRFGLSLVTIVFDDATDVYWARQQVNEKLAQVKDQIPTGAGRPELAPVTTGLGEIFQYAVRPKKGYEGKYDAMELRTIQDWIIRRQLLGTPGVADVSSFGGYLKQYEVSIRQDKLQSMGVTVTDVFSALEQNNQNTGGTYIEKGPNILYIRSEGLARTIEDINSIVIKQTKSGIPVFVRDVAKVQIGHAVRYGAMCFNDQGEVAGAVVMMLKGENSSKVINAVKEKIKNIEKALPEGVVIEPFLDRTKMVNNAIGTVETNLLEGALIVIFILVLFLGNLRAGLIVASVIPLSMLFAVIMMNMFKVSGNLMSLGALDFGLIVDGAVIIVEAVMHRLYHSRHFATVNVITKEQMNHEVETSAGKMMNSAVFGQIIILIVYLPILTLVGIEGKMFKPMAQTVSFALIGAFILSLTYVPMITSLVLKRTLSHKETWADKIMRFLEKMYQPTLELALRFPKWLVSMAVVAFIFAMFIMTRLGGEFIPELEEGDFAVDTRVLTGSSLTTTIESTQKTAAILLAKFPEVIKVVTKIGSGEIPTDPMPVEASDMMVILKNKKEWTSAKTFDELANKMSKELEVIPGTTVGFQFPVQMRFNELMTGARQDVVCKIFGEDLDSLAAYSQKLGTIIGTVEGAKDLYVETVTGLPQIVIEYDRAALARYQLSVAEVNRVVQTAFAGQSAGMIYENERRFDLVVRMDAAKRTDIADVQRLLLNTPNGTQVPLYAVAKVEVKEGPNQIQREDAKRRIVVGFNTRGRDVQSIVEELGNKVDKELRMAPGYYVTYGGQFENLVEAKQRLSIALPVALLLIFIMLYFAFGKLKYGALIFSAIPLSAIGGILALWMRGMPFSISAGIGFIALFGVAVLNGIVLIAEFNRLKEHGLHDLKYIVMEGTKVRLRPVLMTAAVASLGFLPMALSNGAGAEVQRPLATVVIGGLITATLLTLLLLPVLYQWFEIIEHKKRSRSKPIATTIILLLCSTMLMAQPISGTAKPLDEMMSMLPARNLQLQQLKMDQRYWKQARSNTFETPLTQVGVEYGNVNSFNTDTRFYANQTFLMPVVYKRQRTYYSAQESGSKEFENMKLVELQRELRWIYYDMLDMMDRYQYMQQLDTVWEKAVKAATLRVASGDAAPLEKANAEMLRQQWQLQQMQLLSDLKVMQQQLQFLLQSPEALLPVPMKNKKFLPTLFDTSSLGNHPMVRYQKQLESVAVAQTALERSKKSPDLTVGYGNLSFVGWQSPDGVSQKYYKAGDRFNVFSFSMGIPLFTKGIQARIKAAQILEEKSRHQTQLTSAALQNQWLQSVQQYKQQQENVKYFETVGLQQAALVLRTAGLGYAKGDISYLEWSQSVQHSIQMQIGYFDALRLLNRTAIEMEYLSGK